MELKPLLIENARLLGGETGSLLVVAGRIAAQTPAGTPDGAERVDAKGQWLAPGIIDLGVFATDKPAFHFGGITRAALMPAGGRSEEHTSALQSLMRHSYAVFCLKNTNITNSTSSITFR